MSDAAEIMAEIKFEAESGLGGKWVEGLWDMLPLMERIALRNNMASFIAALKAKGLVIVSEEPTEAMLEAGGTALFIQGRGGKIQAGRLYKAMIGAGK